MTDAKDARIAELVAEQQAFMARQEQYEEAYDRFEAEVTRLREALHLQRRTYPHERYVPELLEALSGGGQECPRCGKQEEHVDESDCFGDPEAERGVSAGGNIVCPHCHAHIAWEGERPTDCLGCGAATDGFEDGHWLYEEGAEL